MKKLVLIFIIGFLFLSACTSQPENISGELGQEFVLIPGQSASITGESLDINFVKIVNDSRCPTGVTCIWEGQVSCLLNITYNGTVYEMVLVQSGSSQSTMDFNNYELAFDIEPYPKSGTTISEGAYRLHLTVTKQTLAGGILASFKVVNEEYSIFITNNNTIDQVFALQAGESNATIPNGRLVEGSVFYNQPWSWHIDPQDISMAEVTIELCDGTPSQVEDNLDYWINTVKYY